MQAKLPFLLMLGAVVGLVAGQDIGEYSERTVVAGIQIDRDSARLIAFTLKPRPFERAQKSSPAAAAGNAVVAQLEVRLHGPEGRSVNLPVEVPGLCLEHPADTPPHFEGDTVRHHREAFLVELPELPGWDRVEVTSSTGAAGQLRPEAQRVLGNFQLTPEKFTPAGTKHRYSELAFAQSDVPEPSAPAASPSTVGAIHWPEEYGDTNRYLVYGNEAEAAKRINIVLIPDGYTYAQKSLLETHAANLVAHFRGQPPFREHDVFVNYILVYAYSTEDGTDQCDCGIIRDTPIATGFPYGNGVCGSDANRTLTYGSGCDDPQNNYLVNLSNAEMRAPAWNTTIILVNTERYGGTGGSRATYAAANEFAPEIALHEIAHTLAGLADEYAGDPSCGFLASEYNTSLNSSTGAWPEWIPELGPPREGAQYYNRCIYRPTDGCKMRFLNEPFCPVCLQKWSLNIFFHFRVNPTAPALRLAPASPLTVPAGAPIDFSVSTRLSSLASNTIVWRVHGPSGSPTTVASNTPAYTHTFRDAARYAVECEVTASVNFIKPSRNGANYEQIFWDVTAAPAPYLRLRAAESAGSYQLSITNLSPGKSYSVDHSVNLRGNNWAVSTGFTAVASSTNILLNPTNPTATFYRVRSSP